MREIKANMPESDKATVVQALRPEEFEKIFSALKQGDLTTANGLAFNFAKSGYKNIIKATPELAGNEIYLHIDLEDRADPVRMRLISRT